MEKLIEFLQEKIDCYNEILKHREDEWLKGYVTGLIQAKQEAETIQNLSK